MRSDWTILLAEDDPELRALLVLALTRSGYAVAECANGKELVELVARYAQSNEHGLSRCVVASDYRMPVLDGISALRQVRRTTEDLQFVLMTSYGEDSIRHEASELGAAVVLTKPFPPNRLAAVIGLMIGSQLDDAEHEQREETR